MTSSQPPQPQNSKDAAALIAQFNAQAKQLVQILHAFVGHYSYISEEAVRQIAEALNLSVAEVYGVVHFYDDFKTQPPGKCTVKICQAESCQAMGSRQLTAQTEQLLGAKLNSTTDDGLVTLEAVYCLGNCACSPSVMVDEKVYGRVDVTMLAGLIDADKTSL